MAFAQMPISFLVSSLSHFSEPHIGILSRGRCTPDEGASLLPAIWLAVLTSGFQDPCHSRYALRSANPAFGIP